MGGCQRFNGSISGVQSMTSTEWVVIIGALISAASAITTALISARKGQAVRDIEVDDHFKLMESDTEKKIDSVSHKIETINTKIDNLEGVISDKIDELEVAQTKHNNLMTRTFMLEKAVGILEEKQKTANHRIADLEGNHVQNNNCKST